MKYQVLIHHWGGGTSILTHLNRTEWSQRTAKKHKSDLIKRNLKSSEFKAIHLVSSGDVWGFQKLSVH